jgi:UDP-4-amino-4,6-dideoxy-N-acetyl-beta-L-altrosamine transaminase
MSYIPYGKQDISEEDIASVVSVLRSDYLTQGPKVPEFENALANYCGSNHVIAVNSATSALHIACLALGLGEGDFLWTSPITFVASANCGLYCGAQVDFVDIDPHTYNMSAEALEKKLIQAQAAGALPKIVVPVHLTGQPCDMKAIHALACKYGFKIIEDASHAVGGRYQNFPIGNCKYSDITVFSFHPVKIITTAEGGAALTNDADLASKMNLFRGHGITKDENCFQKNSDGPWYYEQIALGFNYRMTELQAALGVSQLKRVDEFVSRRHELVNRYNKLLKNLPLTTPFQTEDGYSAFHLYVIRLDNQLIDKGHLQVFESLRGVGIGVNLHYIPVYRHPYYRHMGFDQNGFPSAEKYYQEAISLPMFSAMSFEEQDQVVRALKRAIGL